MSNAYVDKKTKKAGQVLIKYPIIDLEKPMSFVIE